MREQWKKIPGYDYEISTLGRVRSTKSGGGHHGRRWPKGHILALVDSWSGAEGDHYLAVPLRRKGKVRKRLVHHVVLEVFVGKRPRGSQVNHKNGIKKDNRLSNLEYVTPQENSLHSRRVLGKGIGERHGRAKLTEQEVREIRRRYGPPRLRFERGEPTLAQLSKEYGINAVNIRCIILRKTWTHI